MKYLFINYFTNTKTDKLSIIPEVNTYEENTTEMEKELSSSPFEIPSEPMDKPYMNKIGGKRKTKKKTKKKSFFLKHIQIQL